MKKTRKNNPALKNFRLVDDTVGFICGGIWIKNDGSELKIKNAFKDGFLCFRPLKENEKSL